jgi:hypothetical protein
VAFRIQPHMRLHEWVADEAGFFRDEGLDYEFEAGGFAAGTAAGGTVTAAGEQPGQIRSGAFEDMARGRESDVSCACHWAVNAASAADHGKMYGLAYSVCPSGIFVPPGSACQQPSDLADTTFVMGFLVSPQARREDVDRYFRGLLRAQQEIDLEPARYKHFWLREMPQDLRDLADVRRFGPGERIVPQPYTREMYLRTHRWMRDWDLADPGQDGTRYDEAVLG